LSTIQSKYGVFAVTGNHEYIGGVDAATDYLQNYGVSVLRDSVVKIVDSIYLIGREDRSIRRFSGKARTSLDSLMQGVDRNYPCFLLDHQPFELSEAARNGIDLQICGHTHHGQLWPLNLITRMLYEKSWGYLKRGDTHYYISSGAGTWGPPVRIGNHPEIVEIVVHFLE
ncbi:MAG: metallophosphoesterase, partial [bacterium]|nr:metallophosphoesterase [bacterium]